MMGKCDWTMEEAKRWVREHKEFEYQEETIGDAEAEVEIKEDKAGEIETTKELDEKIKEYQKECEHDWYEITAKNAKYLKEYTCTKCGMMKSEPVEPINYTGIEFAIKDLTGQIAELKEGRILSTKNRTLVKDTIDALTTLKEKLEELYTATEPPAREEERGLIEREVIIEKDGKQDNLDERIAGAIERLLENDKLSKMMNDAIKEALDVSIKKKLGKVE